MKEIIFSQFVEVLDISWQDMLWGVVWVFVFIGFYTACIIASTWTKAKVSIMKYDVPMMYDNKVYKLEEENKTLKADNKQLEKENREHYDNFIAIKNFIEK